MTATYDCIATTTLGSAASFIEFSSISANYTDLILVVQAKSAGANNLYVRMGNGSVDTGTNYSFTGLAGDGTNAYSDRYTNQTQIQISYYNTIDNDWHWFAVINFQNYANTTTNKTIIARSSSAPESATAVVGIWRSTSAVNVIRCTRNNYDFDTGTTATLYGVKAE